MLKDKLYKIVSNCIIDLNYNPIKLSAREVKEFGYKKASILKKDKFYNKAKRIIYKAFLKVTTFYTNLAIEIVIPDNNENKINILENKE
jgi:hypothetical protein